VRCSIDHALIIKIFFLRGQQTGKLACNELEFFLKKVAKTLAARFDRSKKKASGWRL